MAIDLVPTIADILGLPIDWEVDGAPAGSAAIDARGDSKMIYDLAGLSTVTLEEILEFSDTETFPSVPRGWIGPLSDPDDPLSALNDLLELDGVLGSRLDDLDVREGGGAEIERLPDLQRPPDDAVKLGLVTGRVRGVPRDAQLVIAVDGVVVGGSKLSTDSDGRDGRFSVLLPQGVLDGDNDIRAALVVDGEVHELEVAAG